MSNSTHPTIHAMAANAGKAEAMLKLLANARRLMILCHLVKSPKSVGEITELVDISQSAVSQHLAKMRAQGLVNYRKEGQSTIYYIDSPEAEALLSTLYLIYCRD